MSEPNVRLQRFGVGPWRELDPALIVGRTGYDREEGFFLALALVFNDLKGIVLYEAQLHPHQPDDVTTPERAQWMGIIIQTRRIATGIVCELFELLRRHKDVLEGERFSRLILECPEGARGSWDMLLALALGRESENSALATTMKRIRNQGAFHYYDPQDLARGYQHAFFEQAGTAEQARASVGVDWEATRYFYADNAAAALMIRAAKVNVVDDYQERLGQVIRAVAAALSAIVTLHLVERRDGSF